MQVRCPECLQAIELSSDSTLRKIDCPACGSSFNLVGDETVIGEGKTKFVSDSGVRAIGHFTLNKEVGRGAFGTVWLARDQELDRDVAVKVPRHGQLNGDEAERFFREARASAQIRHANIVSVHEVGRDGDTIFVVSDFVHGVTLLEWLESQQLTARESAELCVKIADALHHAHEMGIVHRDLKPGNIMMDRDGEPRVMDFGLAKRDTNEVTLTLDGQILGTPAYMSPEQAKGEGAAADRRADIYSLGVVLFQLLTAEVPFRGNVQILVQKIIQEEPPSPRSLNAKIPKDLETICLRCLQKSPQRRYQNMAALAEDLRRWLNKEPITARPIGRVERTWLWCRRKPVIAALWALVFLVAVTGFAAVSWQWREAVTARDLANQKTHEVLGEQQKVRQQRKLAVDAKNDAVKARNDVVEQARVTRLNLYVSDVYKAATVWEIGNMGHLRALLDRHIPKPGEPDNRSFEWYFWSNRANNYDWLTPLVASDEGQAITHQIAILGDNSGVAVDYWNDGQTSGIGIFDASTGKLRRVLNPTAGLTQNGNALVRIASRVSVEGEVVLALLTVEGELVLFNSTTEKLTRPFVDLQRKVNIAEFSPDGELVAACNRDGIVWVWNWKTSTEVCSFRVKPRKGGSSESYPWKLDFSPSGSRLAVSSFFPGSVPIEIYDVQTGDNIANLSQVAAYATGRFADRDDRLITCNGPRTNQVALWDLAGPSVVAVKDMPHSYPQRMAFSSDRSQFVTFGDNPLVHVWDTAGFEPVVTLRGHETGVKAAGFSQDGRFLYSCSPTEIIQWDLARTTAAETVAKANGRSVTGLDIDDAGNRLALFQSNGLRLFNNQTYEELSIPSDGTRSIGAFSNDGRTIISEQRRKIIARSLVDDSSKELAEVPSAAHALSLSPNGRSVVAGGGLVLGSKPDGYIAFSKLDTVRYATFPIPNAAVTDIEFADSDTVLVTAFGKPGSLEKWSVTNRAVEKRVSGRHFYHLAVSMTKGLVAVGIAGGYVAGQVWLYDLETLQRVGTLPSTGGNVRALEFLSDGRTLAVADGSITIKLWNTQTLQLAGELRGHDEVVGHLAAAIDPPRLFSSTKKGEIRVWYGGLLPSEETSRPTALPATDN